MVRTPTAAIDDHAALLFHDEQPAALYRWKGQASARVLQSAAGALKEGSLNTPLYDL